MHSEGKRKKLERQYELARHNLERHLDTPANEYWGVTYLKLFVREMNAYWRLHRPNMPDSLDMGQVTLPT